MSELCKCGSGKENNGRREFKFSYKYLNLTVTITGSECEDCSFNRHNIIELIDKYGERLIKNEWGCPTDWDFYCKFMEEEHGEESQSLNDILVALGRFSIDPKNNWIITDGLIVLNPSWHSSPLYFTGGINAIAYAELKFSKPLHWKIMKISDVFQRSDIFK